MLSPQEIRDGLTERLKVLSHGLPGRRGTAPVAESLRRVVLRPVLRAGAAAVDSAVGVHRPVRSRGRDRRVRCGRPPRRRAPRPDELTRRPVRHRRRGGRPGPHPVPHARRHPSVRSRAGREGRRAPRPAGTTRDLVLRAGLPVRRRSRVGRTNVAGFERLRLEQANLRAALEYLARTAGGRRDRPGAWPEGSTSTGPPPVRSTKHATGWSSPLASGAGEPQERGPRAGPGGPVRRPPERPAPGQGAGRGGRTKSLPPSTTPAGSGCCSVPAAMLSVWDGNPAAAAEQADGAVALLRPASELPGELLALFVAGVCHGFARQQCGGHRPAPASASPGPTRSANAT